MAHGETLDGGWGSEHRSIRKDVGLDAQEMFQGILNPTEMPQQCKPSYQNVTLGKGVNLLVTEERISASAQMPGGFSDDGSFAGPSVGSDPFWPLKQPLLTCFLVPRYPAASAFLPPANLNLHIIRQRLYAI